MKVAKAFYFLQLVSAAIVALILREYGGGAGWLHTAASFTGVCVDGDDACLGNSLVFRVRVAQQRALTFPCMVSNSADLHGHRHVLHCNVGIQLCWA